MYWCVFGHSANRRSRGQCFSWTMHAYKYCYITWCNLRFPWKTVIHQLAGYWRCMEESLRNRKNKDSLRIKVNTTSSQTNVHYSPHHPMRKKSATTSIRIVYDCSCKQSPDAPSLNDYLHLVHHSSMTFMQSLSISASMPFLLTSKRLSPMCILIKLTLSLPASLMLQPSHCLTNTLLLFHHLTALPQFLTCLQMQVSRLI